LPGWHNDMLWPSPAAPVSSMVDFDSTLCPQLRYPPPEGFEVSIGQKTELDQCEAAVFG